MLLGETSRTGVFHPSSSGGRRRSPSLSVSSPRRVVLVFLYSLRKVRQRQRSDHWRAGRGLSIADADIDGEPGRSGLAIFGGQPLRARSLVKARKRSPSSKRFQAGGAAEQVPSAGSPHGLPGRSGTGSGITPRFSVGISRRKFRVDQVPAAVMASWLSVTLFVFAS